MEHLQGCEGFCNFREPLHALCIEHCISCVACAESMHPTNEFAQTEIIFVLGMPRVLEVHGFGGIGVMVVLIMVVPVVIPSRASRILGVFSEPMFHHFVFIAGIFKRVTHRVMVELTVGEVSACSFPCVIEVWCFVGGTFWVHGEEPVIQYIPVFLVEAIEEVCIPFFI